MRKEDRLIFSKGHAAPALYVVLNKMGKISDLELSTFHKNGTKLPGHTPIGLDDSIPFPSGSLGHGLSLACGIAQGVKYLNKKSNKSLPTIFCLISDGECNEGQVWEAAQYASAKKISNLVVLIDNNGLQAFGKTKDVLGNGATVRRWEAFGFEVYESDGHNPKEIKKYLSKATMSKKEKPKVIIFNTIKGYGVDFMEGKIAWHYNTLTEDLYKKALVSIDKKVKN